MNGVGAGRIGVTLPPDSRVQVRLPVRESVVRRCSVATMAGGLKAAPMGQMEFIDRSRGAGGADADVTSSETDWGGFRNNE